MSPQVENSVEYKNTDVFSLGMMWFKLLTGHFMAEHSAEYKDHLKTADSLHQLKLHAFNSKFWIQVARTEF